MSLRYSSMVWADNTVHNTQKLMLLALADFANDEGVCWPPMNRLAQMAGVSVRQAQRLIADLEDAGKVYVQRGSGRGNASVYMLMYGTKTVTAEAETVTHGAKSVSFVSPIAEAQRVTTTASKGDTDGAKGDTGGTKGDMLPHTHGQPSIKPSSQPSSKPSSSSARAAAAMTEAVSVVAEDEDEDSELLIEDPLLEDYCQQLEAITGRRVIAAECRALDDAIDRWGVNAVDRALDNLRNVWDRIQSRHNLANWIRTASERASVSARTPAHRTHDSAESRKAAYLPAW